MGGALYLAESGRNTGLYCWLRRCVLASPPGTGTHACSLQTGFHSGHAPSNVRCWALGYVSGPFSQRCVSRPGNRAGGLGNYAGSVFAARLDLDSMALALLGYLTARVSVATAYVQMSVIDSHTLSQG